MFEPPSITTPNSDDLVEETLVPDPAGSIPDPTDSFPWTVPAGQDTATPSPWDPKRM